MSSDRAVVLLLYRSILRWHRRIEAVPLQIRSSHIAELLPQSAISGEARQDAHATLLELARHAFRQQLPKARADQEDQRGLRLDQGFHALHLLNTEYAQAVRVLQALRSEHQDAQGIHYPVGTVFRHKKYGYKGVIYGWDRVCDRPDGWAQQMKLNGKQPFYSVLPDEPDCERLFSAVRTSKYVAQENVEVLQKERVVHRAIMSYFTDYSPQLGRYIPNKRVQYEYPGDYQASDAQSCQADSNLLLHADPYPYPDPYADPYEDSPDSQHSQCPAEQAESHKPVAAVPEESTGNAVSADRQTMSQPTAESSTGDPSSNGDPSSSGDPSLPEQNVGTDVKR